MNAQRIVTAALLGFVGLSVAAVVYRETLGRSTAAVAPAETTAAAVPRAGPARRVVAYYFHGNVRCPTCRRIEALSQAAITNGFAAALARGALEWRAVNVETPGQEHFVRDYDLTTRSLVLAELRDGQPDRAIVLSRVWELAGDPVAFTDYVQENVRACLEKD